VEAQPRLAAELEFDLQYFKEGAAIREYFEVSDHFQIDHYRSRSKDLPEISAVFSRKKQLSPEVNALLDRFELSWEIGYTPPKVEIRHRGTFGAAVVKNDIKALLRLFASSDSEAQELYKHLSSVKASSLNRPHLNAHIHASNPEGASRVEEMKALQILTTLEFAKDLDEETAKRLFTSELSSYSQNLWTRGVGRSIGLSRYESRKRSVPIDQDIDRLNEVMSPSKKSEHVKSDVLGLLNGELVEKVLNIPLKPTELAGKINFFEDLVHLSQGSPQGDEMVSVLLSEKAEKAFGSMLARDGFELEASRLLLKLRQNVKGSEFEIKKIDNLLVQKLEELDSVSKRKLLVWLSGNYSKTEMESLNSNKLINEKFFSPVFKDLLQVNLADNYSTSHEQGYHEYLSVNPEVMPFPIKAQVKAYQRKALADDMYWRRNGYHLHMGMRDNLLEFFDYMPAAHVDKLFEHLRDSPHDIHPEIEEAVNSFMRKHEQAKVGDPQGVNFSELVPAGSNCRRWLAQ